MPITYDDFLQGYDAITGARPADAGPALAPPEPEAPGERARAYASASGAVQRPAAPPAFGASPDSMLEEVYQGQRRRTAQENMEKRGELTRGVLRGIDEMQGSLYGMAGLAGSAMGIDRLKDWGIEGYRRNVEEAELNPAAVPSFRDIEGPVSAYKYGVGKVGELLPSVAESVGMALLGGAAGTAVEPGGGTVAGAAAGFLGKTALKKSIEKMAGKMVAEGISREAAEQAASRLAMRSLGGATGVVAGTFPLEAGGNYAEALVERGADAPLTAAATGLASSFLELAGGSYRTISKIVGPEKTALFKKALEKADTSLLGSIIKEAGIQAPQEFAQEAGQELLSIANLAVADPTFEAFTGENAARMFEAGMAGAVGGGVFGGIGGAHARIARQRGAAMLQGRIDELAAVPEEQRTDDQQAELAQKQEELQKLYSDIDRRPVPSSREEIEAEQQYWDQYGRNFPPESIDREAVSRRRGQLADGMAVQELYEQQMERAQRVPDSSNVLSGAPHTESAGPVTTPGSEASDILQGGAIRREPLQPAAKSAAESAGVFLEDFNRMQSPVGAELLRDRLAGEALRGIQRESYPEPPAPAPAAPQQAPEAAAIDRKAHEAATSPLNERPEPTEAQKEAGNYRKGRVNFQGLGISIENPQGSVRSGTDKLGNRWESEMRDHYGYILGTRGRDKDHVDVFIGPDPGSERAFVVDQIDPETGKFDEHKVILGANTQEEAETIYRRNHATGWRGMGAITEMGMKEFKRWARDPKKTRKPVSYKEGQAYEGENQAGMGSALGAGQEAGGAVPERGAGGQAAPGGGVFQAPEGRQEPVAPEASVPYAGPERRKDIEERKRVGQMSPEEMRRELLTNPVTGIPNRRAFEEAEKHPVQASIDVDGLKWVNDNMGHGQGDALLKKVAEALHRNADDTFGVFHVSGDEFVAHGVDEATVRSRIERAREALGNVNLEHKAEDGTIRRLEGLGFSYGTGKGLEEAEAGLRAEKAERESLGLRAGRGERPKGLVEIPAPGRHAEDTGEREGTVAEAPERPALTEEEARTINPDETLTHKAGFREYLTRTVAGIRRVSGKPIKLSALPGREFFAYQSDGRWAIVDKETGAAVTYNEMTLKGAVEWAEISLEDRDRVETYLDALKDYPVVTQPGTKTETVPAAKTETVPAPSASQQLAVWVKEKVTAGKMFSANDLFGQGNEVFGGGQAEGKYTPKNAYDAMEMGVNQYILDQFSGRTLPAGVDVAKDQIHILQGVINLLPTQSKRTAEMDEFQQFSTPPPLAYLAAWAANITDKDTVLEPSAGVGGLAVFGKAAAAATYVNELSPRRAALLKQMGFDRVFTENAEQLDNILPDEVKPTLVIMNPPFSSTAGRITGQRKTSNAERHIEQALNRLQPGGRLVAIVGRGMSTDAPSFRAWWKKIQSKYAVRADIGISGKGYRKYGTTFDNRLIIIDKIENRGYPITKGSVEDVKDAVPLLQGVRDARPAPETHPVAQQEAPQPSGVESPQEGARPGGQLVSPRTSTDVVGAGVGQTGSGRSTEGGRGRPAQVGAQGPHEPSGENVSRRPNEPGQPSGQTAPRTGVDTSRSSAEPVNSREHDVEVEQTQQETSKAELSDSVYDKYQPGIKVAKAKPHPGTLVESAAMAAVKAPATTYRPSIPEHIISQGNLSDAQLEIVVRAGQAHETILDNGERQGFFIGDGTGVGKGREIAGILLDNWNKGRKKAVWLSANSTLFNDAQRDVGGIGDNPEKVFDLGDIKRDAEVKHKEGILFTTYATLKSQTKGQDGAPPTDRRLDQIGSWLGKDFDGTIVFDESHQMGNAVELQGERGVKKPSLTALVGLEFQDRFPNARIVYVSATGATEVLNLAYAKRLGLWGPGTAFADLSEFISQISSGGIAAMELVARDLKSMGKYMARSLSYHDVTYDRLEHVLSSDQRQIYDKLAEGWQLVLNNVNEALETTRAGLDSRAKSSALSAFWGTHQRFFNQVITSLQMPTVLNRMRKELDAGHSCVIQLVNTQAAGLDRAIAKLGEEDTLEDLDITPRDQLAQYIHNSFPVFQYEDYLDDNGNVRSRPVLDSNGNHVENREAVRMRDKLLEDIGSIKVPDGPMEMILNEFGTKNVAEVTGRKQRVVIGEDGQRVKESRSKTKCEADSKAFQAGKKRVLIFSSAGGTGLSYHADLSAENQEKRIHFLVQPGWRADVAVQGFGRTHRTNQKQAPHYLLVTTDLKGQKRFLSSIARRLDQLGALTKGSRQTGSQGFFSARDNLESQYATDAMMRFLNNLVRNGEVAGITLNEFQDQTGLKLVNENGTPSGEYPRMTQFLNRLLSLKCETQNGVFDAFSEELDTIIQREIEMGTLDLGLENIHADKIELVKEQVVHTDEKTGAETKYVEVDVTNPSKRMTYAQVHRSFDSTGYYQNVKSGKIWSAGSLMLHTNRDGTIETRVNLTSPAATKQRLTSDDLGDTTKWTQLKGDKAIEAEWTKQYNEVPPTTTERKYMITGAVLPIWDRLTGNTRIVRLQTDDGKRLLGRLINHADLRTVLTNLGATMSDQKKYTPAHALDLLSQGFTLNLANGWTLVERTVSGEKRIELKGPNFAHNQELDLAGVFREKISWETRYFVPRGDEAADVIAKLTKNKPIVDETAPYRPGAGGRRTAFSISRDGELKRKLSNLFDYAVENPAGKIQKVEIGIVDQAVIDKVKEKQPDLDIAGYRHVVDNYSIRHILKQHGNPQKEASRGQIAITKEDILRIPDIVQAPDTVRPSKSPTRQGHGAIWYIKRVNGFVYYMEEVRDAKQELVPKTMYKKAGKATASSAPFGAPSRSERPPSERPKTLRGPTVDNIRQYREIINSIVARLPGGPRIEPVRSIEDLPARIAQEAKKRGGVPEAAYDRETGAIYLVGENIPTPERLQEVLLHEIVGHHGVEALLGDKLQPFLKEVFLLYGPKGLQEIADLYGFDLGTREGRMNAAREKIARMAETGEKPGFLKKLYAAIREALRSLGFTIKLSDDDIKALVARAGRAMESGGALGPGARGKFAPRYSQAAPMFYSQLQRTLLNKLPGSGNPAMINAMIDSWAKKGEFKAEELEWSGLREWLAERKGKIGKQEILDFLKQNEVRVEEVERGERPEPELKAIPAKDYTGKAPWAKDAPEDSWIVYLNGKEIFVAEGATNEGEAIIQYDPVYDDDYDADTKYAQYTQPSGNYYRELLLTLPDRTSLRTKEIKAQLHMMRSLRMEFSEEYRQIVRELQEEPSPPYRSTHWDESNVLAHVRFDDRAGPNGERLLHIAEVQSDWHQEGRRKGYADVPNAPFKTTWPMLAMKRMIRYAAENGYDGISWDPGSVQAERYDLSKHISRLEAYDIGEGLYNVFADDHGGNRVLERKNIPESELPDLVGKELAEKIINSQYRRNEFTGLDLKVGGEGMKGFYDRILPAEVNKYVKKWGAKVGETSIMAGDDTVHYLPVTDAMRDAAMKGQPLFSMMTPEWEFKTSFSLKDAARTELLSTTKAAVDRVKGRTETGFLGRLFITAEHWKHKVGKAIFDAAQGREEDRHQIMNVILKAPEVADAFKKIMFEGKDWWTRQKGYDLYDQSDAPKPYRNAAHHIDAMDRMNWKWTADKDKDGNPVYQKDANGKTIEPYRDKLLREGKVSRETIAVIDKAREMLDAALDLQRADIRELLDHYEKAGKPVPVIGTQRDAEGRPRQVTLKDLYNQMGFLKGSYSPRIREAGDWYVTSMKGGERYRFHQPSRRAAYKFIERLKREGHKNIGEPQRIERLPESVYQDISIPDIQAAVDRAIRGADLDPETAARMRREVLESAADILKERGFRAHKIQRSEGDVVRGYITDPLTRNLMYAQQTAGGIAKSKAASKMFRALMGEYKTYEREGDEWVLRDDAGDVTNAIPLTAKELESARQTKSVHEGGIDPAREPERYQTYVDYIHEMLRNPDATDRAIAFGKSLVSFKYLGLSPRSVLANVTALATTVPPALHEYAMGGKGSLLKVGKELTGATRDFARVMTGKQLENADERAFMDQVKGSANLEQFTREAMANLAGAYGRSWQVVMDKAMWMFRKSEEWIRGSTMLAGYRLARERGLSHEDAVDAAMNASNKAHGIYGKATMPIWAMGSNPAAKIGQMGYTYAKFAHNYLQTLHDLGANKRNVKAFVFALLSPAVLAGSSAMVATPILLEIGKVMMRAVGDDRDPEKMVYDVIRENLGGEAERFARFGLLGMAGIDLSGSLAVGMQTPRTLLDLTGAFGGVVEDIGRAGHYLATGQPGRAAERAAPVVMGNFLRAMRELNGATTSDGNRVWDEEGKPYVPTGGETAGRVMGFKSGRRATVEARERESRREQAKFSDRRKNIYEEYRAYLSDPERDPEKLRDVLDKVQRYNAFLLEHGMRRIVPLISRDSMRDQVRKMLRPSGRRMEIIENYREGA